MRQVQEEISSLEMALGRKQRELAAIKKDLGITPLTQLKEDVKMGYEELKQSKAVQSTKEFFKNLGEKISSSDFYKSAQSAATTVGEKGGDALRAAGSKTSEAFGKAKMSMKENQTLQNIGGKIRSTSMSIKEK
ncbi:tumor protein D52-like [Corticium candelabrum]|uniref:tumor protein D52-like n=1 Tax=Corticium candelabrum TaxID=121492 RepID=UPI002E2670B3|nr:tumor protein D52-like [Corticium candelabrum]